MNILKRAKQIGLRRFIKKAICYDEVYALGLRKRVSFQANEAVDKTVPFKVIEPPKEYWLADPLLFSYQKNDYLYMEKFDNKAKKGSIACFDMNHFKEGIEPVTVIEEPYHMSFPMVFQWNNSIFMIPETSENHSINLYISEKMPYQWKLAAAFQTEALIVDSVVLNVSNEKIDVLGSEVQPENELYVKYFKYSIIKNETSYSILYDADYNKSREYNLAERNGGKILPDKKLLPMQYSSEIDYGVGIRFIDSEQKSVDEINKENINLNRLPKKNVIGIHTYSCTDHWEVVDIRYLKYEPLLNWYRIKSC